MTGIPLYRGGSATFQENRGQLQQPIAFPQSVQQPVSQPVQFPTQGVQLPSMSQFPNQYLNHIPTQVQAPQQMPYQFNHQHQMPSMMNWNGQQAPQSPLQVYNPSVPGPGQQQPIQRPARVQADPYNGAPPPQFATNPSSV